MTGSVLDILIYVFDQYMLAEAPEVPEREALAADLERAGFGRHNVERALDCADAYLSLFTTVVFVQVRSPRRLSSWRGGFDSNVSKSV